jgi:hypothetical protein
MKVRESEESLECRKTKGKKIKEKKKEEPELQTVEARLQRIGEIRMGVE